MTGSIAPNFHEGSRSEILADYLLSTWGTVTPVRRQDDYGIDLFCTLTETIGQRAVVTDYYSVQIKSTDDPWLIQGQDSVRWLVEHPTPLFLGCIDKRAGVLSIYKTLPRFLAAFWEPIDRLELVPLAGDEGYGSGWTNPSRFELSVPILRVQIADLLDAEAMGRFREVLQFWVRIDRQACRFRSMGVLRLREPYRYRVNQVPDEGIVENGNARPTTAQLETAIETTVEVLDCVGVQLLAQPDQKAALYAALLLNHLRNTHGAMLTKNTRFGPDTPCTLEREVALALNKLLIKDRSPSYVFETLDEARRQIESSPSFRAFTAT
jgi:hypothetical protein